MSRGYVYLELRRTLRYGAPGARIDVIQKNRASCTTRLARSRSPITCTESHTPKDELPIPEEQVR